MCWWWFCSANITVPYSFCTIDFVTIANTANAIDFGDMQDTAYHYGTTSNQTRGLFAGEIDLITVQLLIQLI